MKNDVFKWDFSDWLSIFLYVFVAGFLYYLTSDVIGTLISVILLMIAGDIWRLGKIFYKEKEK